MFAGSMNMNAYEYFSNSVWQEQNRELRFSPIERGREDASNRILLIFLPFFKDF